MYRPVLYNIYSNYYEKVFKQESRVVFSIILLNLLKDT